MPGTDDYGQEVPYPKLSDAPNIEAAMSALVNGVVPLTNMIFANANERAASVPAPVAGMESYLVAEARKEYYNGSAWVSMTPGPWTPLPFNAGYNARAGNPGFQIVGDMVRLRGLVQRTDAGQMHTTDADPWLEVAALPIGARPATTKDVIVAVEWRSNNQSARLSIGVDGVLSIGIVTNLSLFPTWASLDGVEFGIKS